jgi:DNA-binding response OmpR family regulator
MSTDTTSKLLIVEDEPFLSVFYRDVLEGVVEGEILLAFDGPSGLKMAKTHRPDVILLDIHLPLMNGFRVLEKLAEENLVRQCHVIINTSAALSVEEKVKAFDLGVHDYLDKTIEPLELVSRVKGVLQRKRSQELLLEEREKTARLEGVLQTIRRMHHEINNPLNVIQAVLQWMDDPTPGEEDESDYKGMLRDAADQIEAFSRRLGTVTELETFTTSTGSKLLKLPGEVSLFG